MQRMQWRRVCFFRTTENCFYLLCACKGKGGFDVPEGKEICPECKGSGHVVVKLEGWGICVQQNCKNCYATGFIDKETNNN